MHCVNMWTQALRTVSCMWEEPRGSKSIPASTAYMSFILSYRWQQHLLLLEPKKRAGTWGRLNLLLPCFRFARQHLSPIRPLQYGSACRAWHLGLRKAEM